MTNSSDFPSSITQKSSSFVKQGHSSNVPNMNMEELVENIENEFDMKIKNEI